MKKENKITDYHKNSLLEEFEYLAHNPSFTQAVDRLREKYKLTIPMSVKYINNEPIWNVSLETKLKLPEEIRHLAERCKAYKSKYKKQFINLLDTYVITGKIGNPYLSDKSEKPRMQIIVENGNPVVKIYLHLDTGIEEIKDLIEENSKYIKKSQKKVQGMKFDVSPHFESNLKIWDMHNNQKKTVEEILEMIINEKIINVQQEAYYKFGLRKIIKRIDTRISKSFT